LKHDAWLKSKLIAVTVTDARLAKFSSDLFVFGRVLSRAVREVAQFRDTK